MAVNGGSVPDEVRELWRQTVERVKQVSHSPVLFRALEVTVPITSEDGQFVVGFIGTDGQMSGAMRTSEHLGTIERALRAVSRNPELRLRVIDGGTYHDWEETRARDAAAAAARVQTAQKRSVESAAYSTWDQIYEQTSRLWAGFELRSLPTGRARFLDSAFDLVIKAMASGMYPTDDTTPDEPTERGLSRVIERIASMSGSDSAIIGFLLMERWKARRGA